MSFNNCSLYVSFKKECGVYIFQKSIPFAVVGSNTVVEAGGKKIRGRMYPWGIVEGMCSTRQRDICWNRCYEDVSLVLIIFKIVL